MAGRRRSRDQRWVGEVMEKICETAAQALYRYCDVAGQIGSKGKTTLFMPESFLGGFLLERLGNFLTISLETNYKDLEDFWQLQKGQLGDSNKVVDAIVYSSDSTDKSQQSLVLLLEFKLLKPFTEDDSDRDKLFQILNTVEPPLWGAVCTVLDRDKAGLDLSQEAQSAETHGDLWYRCDAGPLPRGNESMHYTVCARLFSKVSSAER
jgi:hypothetical protein